MVEEHCGLKLEFERLGGLALCVARGEAVLDGLDVEDEGDYDGFFEGPDEAVRFGEEEG